MTRNTEKMYLEELIYQEEIISIFAALVQPLQENAFPCAEKIFQQVSAELIYSSSAIEHIYLCLPTLADKIYKILNHEGATDKFATFNDIKSVNTYFNKKHPNSTVKTEVLEISDKIHTASTTVIEKAYLVYTTSDKSANKRPRLSSYDAHVTSALEQLITFTEKNNKDRMTGLMRRDVAHIRMQNIIQSINDKSINPVTAEKNLRKRERPNQLSVMITDIDNFKKLNDKYGHKIGDVCLTSVAQILKQNIKRQIQNSTDFGDIVARWGGEEFLIVLPQCDHQSAKKIAEDIRQKVESKPVEYKCESDITEIKVTLSIGLVTLSLEEENAASFNQQDFDKLIKYADVMVYKAKHNGRNKVEPEQTTYEKLIQIDLNQEKANMSKQKSSFHMKHK